jgi:hypothetical protein
VEEVRRANFNLHAVKSKMLAIAGNAGGLALSARELGGQS